MNSPLANPAWFALSTTQSVLAEGRGQALRYLPDAAPFAALADDGPRAFDDLVALLRPGDFVLVQALAPWPAVAGLQVDQVAVVRQMVDTRPPAQAADDGLVELRADDVADMVALARRTNPGPFGPRTRETGQYLGLRDAGRLVAMAGERMRLAGHVEISAVCVDDTHRGRGLAARLMNVLRQRIAARGETPFLHVRDDNTGAIALYERLGFATRESFALYRVALSEPLGA